MTDYEKDFNHWQNDQSVYSDFIPAPKRSDYDEHGYKKDSVVYDGNLVLDKYLVNTYGIEYARKNPREVLKKSVQIANKSIKDSNMLEIVKEICKKTIGYELDKIKIEDNKTKHIHSDEFLENHPERKETPEFTEEEERETLIYLKQLAKII